MDYNSKFLVMVSVGVLGVGSSMPYWSAFSHQKETSESNPAVEFQSGYAENLPPVVNRTSATKLNAFIGDQSNHVQNPALNSQRPAPQQRVLRPSYTPINDQPRGLDNSNQVPSLPSQFSAQVSSAARKPPVSLSPEGYQGVSLAQRPTRTSLPRKVVPISLSEEEDVYYPVSKAADPAKPRPPLQVSSVPQRRVSFDPPPAQRQKYKIRDGDTLEALAVKFLRDKTVAWAIFEANREQLDSPDLLPIGAVLEIPTNAELAKLKDKAAQRPTTSVQSVVVPPTDAYQPQTHLVPIGR